MDDRHPTADDTRLPRAVTHLVTAHEQLGAEHKTLVAEAEGTTAQERRGTVHRMVDRITQAGCTLTHAVHALATAHGLRALKIDRQYSRDADGRDYSPLPCLGDPSETLYEAAGLIDEVAQTLHKAYTPTRKYPGLARARHPRQMETALASLRAALELVCDDLAADQDDEAVNEYAPTLKQLTELKDRVCRTVPTQGAGHVLVSTDLWGSLLEAGIGHAERDVAMLLMVRASGQQQLPAGEIAAQLSYEQSQVEQALAKLKEVGLVREDGTLQGVRSGSAPA
ncbi:hypothetical protein ABZ569_33375 [Streptomyces albus]|uniref:hypothetical protein n=1 Tax=Streptomyces albus TaxID=1888 RepID=UPI0033FB4D81